ncbi:hypothetical protein FE810_14270 [Thalassotalea litorea]|uniref:Uncharacterized protein n=1 Tax=Thalassotalea litorea TaxID=2020715 RepID=A0A5R9INU5_9GAMM|nr:hypothetical protein [Thalassotalea litorea]TLU61669.1 hypothetical protein FE810_14270 [Thalassotalea litorea]
MSLNRKQFDYLQAMGISVWSAREEKFSTLEGKDDNRIIIDQSNKIIAQLNTLQSHPKVNKSKPKSTKQQPKLSAKQQLEACADSRWFADLLVWLGYTNTDITIDDNGLHFGDYCWQFHNKDIIEFSDRHIKTPVLASESPTNKQKRQLFNWFKSHLKS